MLFEFQIGWNATMQSLSTDHTAMQWHSKKAPKNWHILSDLKIKRDIGILLLQPNDKHYNANDDSHLLKARGYRFNHYRVECIKFIYLESTKYSESSLHLF